MSNPYTWRTPKTDWVGTDYFTEVDWVRIVENVAYVAYELNIEYTPNIDVSDGRTILSSADRNIVTDMIEQLWATLCISENRGYVAPRVDYGSAWNSRDLNVIESMTQLAKDIGVDHIRDNYIYNYCGDEIICGDVVSVGLL